MLPTSGCFFDDRAQITLLEDLFLESYQVEFGIWTVWTREDVYPRWYFPRYAGLVGLPRRGPHLEEGGGGGPPRYNLVFHAMTSWTQKLVVIMSYALVRLELAPSFRYE